jgi:hypothetical protein
VLKQSRNHANLPANWQGHTPDYTLHGAAHRVLGDSLTPDFSLTQARNRRTIARLQSVFEHRQQIVQKAQEKKSCQPRSMLSARLRKSVPAV